MVAIFWDYGNCNLSSTLSGYRIVDNIREVAHTFGSVKLFKAYVDWSEQCSSLESSNLRSELQSSGVSLTDCPRDGRRGKDTADKMILVDMLTYAMDNSPSTTLILISGDRDFAYAVSTLRLRQYHVVVVAPFDAHASLKAHASVLLDWNRDIVGKVDVDLCLSTQGSADRSYTSPSPKPVSVPDIPAPPQAPPFTLSPQVNGQVPMHECAPSLTSGHITRNKPDVLKENPPEEPTTAQKFEQHVPLPQTANTRLRCRSPLSSAATPVAGWPKGSLPHKKITTDFLPKSSPDVDGNSDFFTVRSSPSATGTTVHSDPPNHRSLAPHEYALGPVLSRQLADTASNEVPTAAIKPSTFSGIAGHPAHAVPGNFSLPTSSFTVSQHVPSTFPGPVNEKPETSTARGGRPSTAMIQNPRPLFPTVDHNRIVSGPTSGRVKLGIGLCDPVAEDGANLSLPRDRETQRHHVPTFPNVEDISSKGQPRSQESPKALLVSDNPTDTSPTPALIPLVGTQSTSLEDNPSTKYLPPEFTILVEHLKKEHASGNLRALRSNVAMALHHLGKTVYKRAGVTTFRQYTALAEAANIVEMGGMEETAWISLHPSFQAGQSGGLPSQSLANPKAGAVPTKIPPPEFSLLVELLKKEHLKGNPHPSRSIISMALIQQDKSVYNRVGLTKFSEYTALAERMGIVQLGGKRDAWICLHPDWQR